GLNQYSNGVGEYTDGVSEAATGTSDLADGLEDLDQGTGKYAKGVSEFADGGVDGAGEVRTYTAPGRDKLARVASANIEAPDHGAVADVLAGPTIAVLIMLAPCVGGLVTYAVRKPGPASPLLSPRAARAVWLRRAVPRVVVRLLRALAASILAVTVMDIDDAQ